MVKPNRETPQEALERIQSGGSKNDQLVVDLFAGRGIPVADILPRENVLTYRAWQAKGRQVRRGEKSVRLATYVPLPDKPDPDKPGKMIAGGSRPKMAFVFHVSQTDPANGRRVS